MEGEAGGVGERELVRRRVYMYHVKGIGDESKGVDGIT
jgi:hypothetical protein